jgi:hypothetical protein
MRSATPSRSSSNSPAYTSRVIAAEACPSIRCTAFTFAPAATARLAAVCRSSWGVMAVFAMTGGPLRIRYAHDAGWRPGVWTASNHAAAVDGKARPQPVQAATAAVASEFA